MRDLDFDEYGDICHFSTEELEQELVNRRELDLVDAGYLEEITELFLAANWEQRKEIYNLIKKWKH